MKKIYLIALFILFPVSIFAASPLLFFSDITSGPKTGGDTYGGAIVTMWGTNLGASQGTSHVYCGDVESDHVYYWGTADGSSGGGPSNLSKLEIQEISFSVPSTAADGVETIYVAVGGVNSNTLAFTIRTGNIYFVNGNASASGSGTFSDPWKSPASFHSNGTAGDICYFRGPNTYTGDYAHTGWGANLCFYDESPSGTASNPIAYIVYPGETVTSSSIQSNVKGYKDYYVLSKFKFSSTENSIFQMGTGSRLVGLNVVGITGSEQQAGIVEFGFFGGVKLLGSEIHGGASGSKMDHAIYLDGCPTNDLEVGWCYVHDNNFARGPLVIVNHENAANGGSNCVGSADHYIHDNFIDGTGHPVRGVVVYNQGYNTGESGNKPSTYIYNNILVNCGLRDSDGDQGAITLLNGHGYVYNNILYNSCAIAVDLDNLDSSQPLLSSEVRNNILHMRSSPSPAGYIAYNISLPSGSAVSNNCYYGYSGTDSKDPSPVYGDPLFTNAASYNFSLLSTSPCIDKGTSIGTNLTSLVGRDLFGVSRPQGSAFDIGAFESGSGKGGENSDSSNDSNGDDRSGWCFISASASITPIPNLFICILIGSGLICCWHHRSRMLQVNN